ncbi:porin [Neptunicoccus sediminis]|uniref:porin n=1 Tax=Neptunicoccus sediminis TaxID=1892596 RepID=UPI000845F914|nr:porin [Neptunicoccus sediminis]
MKKVLLATTAIIASASAAAADVTLSGSGRFGIVYDSSQDAANESKTKIEKRMTINIDGTGSTDTGLEFGGRIRLRSDEGDASGAAGSANVWLGNDMFRITVGNTDGALVNRIAYFDGTVGLTGLHDADNSFNIGTSQFLLNTYSSRGNAGDIVRLDFNVGGLGVSLSTDSTGDHLSNGSEDSIAASYNFGDWTVAGGYAKNANNSAASAGEQDLWSFSVAGQISDFAVNVNYSDLETVGSKAVLSGSYTFDATTVTAFVAHTDEDSFNSAGIGATGDETEYGLGFTHNLGGAVLAGGVSRNYTEETMADLGVRFAF